MYYEKKGKILKFTSLLIVIFIIFIIGFLIFKDLFLNKDKNLIKGNGRIEARETAVATKFAGRLV